LPTCAPLDEGNTIAFSATIGCRTAASTEEDAVFALRHKTPQQISRVPAAALTAFAGKEDRLGLLAAGYQLHFAKPVDPLELVVAITSLVSAIRETRSPAVTL